MVFFHSTSKHAPSSSIDTDKELSSFQSQSDSKNHNHNSYQTTTSTTHITASNSPYDTNHDDEPYAVNQTYPTTEHPGHIKGGSRYSVLNTWNLFTSTEKRNIAIYIGGIMLYKFGLEAFNGSIVALATNRYDFDAKNRGVTARTFEKVGLLTGLNQAFQCVGSILIAPLIKRFPTRSVLSTAILTFGLLTAILLIVDASTGGRIKPTGWSLTHRKDDFEYYGHYNTDAIIPIYCVTGVAYGMVELIRRVIPRDIVGGDVQKLRRMDAMVHIFYEISGTARRD